MLADLGCDSEPGLQVFSPVAAQITSTTAVHASNTQQSEPALTDLEHNHADNRDSDVPETNESAGMYCQCRCTCGKPKAPRNNDVSTPSADSSSSARSSSTSTAGTQYPQQTSDRQVSAVRERRHTSDGSASHASPRQTREFGGHQTHSSSSQSPLPLSVGGTERVPWRLTHSSSTSSSESSHGKGNSTGNGSSMLPSLDAGAAVSSYAEDTDNNRQPDVLITASSRTQLSIPGDAHEGRPSVNALNFSSRDRATSSASVVHSTDDSYAAAGADVYEAIPDDSPTTEHDSSAKSLATGPPLSLEHSLQTDHVTTAEGNDSEHNHSEQVPERPMLARSDDSQFFAPPLPPVEVFRSQTDIDDDVDTRQQDSARAPGDLIDLADPTNTVAQLVQLQNSKYVEQKQVITTGDSDPGMLSAELFAVLLKMKEMVLEVQECGMHQVTSAALESNAQCAET